MARVSYSEKDRSASDLFWRGIVDPLEEFLASVPGLARRDFASSLGDDGGRYMFQVQWLTGRKANYWHQDVRWKTHWDVVLFLYLGEIPTPTDLACPEEPPASDDPRDYVRHPDGQPEIAERTKSGALTTYRPTIARGDVILIDNRKVWHRTAPTLETTTTSWSVDALMTIRLKHFLA
ncbi:hypothetical protein CTAYLR_006510 [Chrysophaeum taylorii]|uniref:Uncharacterized protein n=1 Tax=Chrysophaeum taylorii TaxID=2483200 RepID=A0AAD7XT79_9STRA|nr:hypothetical protein CTAYLR_006510 [Chrysophaeum taylorii]